MIDPTLWLVGGLILLGGEMAVPGAFLMWLGIAACGTGLLSLAGLALPVQVMVFAVLGFVSVAVGLRLRRRRAHEFVPGLINLPGSGLVGRQVEVLDFAGGEGRVRVGDSDWPARLAHGMPEPRAGARLRVVAVDGLSLMIGPDTQGG